MTFRSTSYISDCLNHLQASTAIFLDAYTLEIVNYSLGMSLWTLEKANSISQQVDITDITAK